MENIYIHFRQNIYDNKYGRYIYIRQNICIYLHIYQRVLRDTKATEKAYSDIYLCRLMYFYMIRISDAQKECILYINNIYRWKDTDKINMLVYSLYMRKNSHVLIPGDQNINFTEYAFAFHFIYLYVPVPGDF